MLEFLDITVSGHVFSTDVQNKKEQYVIDYEYPESKICFFESNDSKLPCRKTNDPSKIRIYLKDLTENQINNCKIYTSYSIKNITFYKDPGKETRRGYIVLPSNIRDLVNGTTDIPIENTNTKEEGHEARAKQQIFDDIVKYKHKDKTEDEYYEFITGKKFEHK